MDEWFKEWFASDYYLEVYNHRNDLDAKKICNLILTVTQIKLGSTILDAACGAGRHANYFSSLGFDVTGFDLSKTLLITALQNSNSQNLKTKFFCSDIRNVSIKSKFDLITNLFTSFGYFQTDEENFAFIKNAFSLLKDSGFYVLDYLNPIFVKNNLVAESYKKNDNLEVVEKRKIISGRVVKEIKIKKNGIEKKFQESVLLYEKEKLLKEIQMIGYRIKSILGDYNGNLFDDIKSPRLILVFQK